MRLTSILNSLFGSGGGDIYLGDTKLDGIVLDKNDGELVASTIASNLDSSGLRISIASSSSVVGNDIRLVATANIEFDSFSWSIEGSATFIGGTPEGSTVYLRDTSVSNNIVTLTATLNGEVTTTQTIVNFTTGVFTDATIAGPVVIDTNDPHKFTLKSNVIPDSVVWGVSGGGTLSSGSSQSEVFITADESGDDIELLATISKAGYIDKDIEFYSAVDKCQVSIGTLLVERPYIISPIDGTPIDSQFSIRVGSFKGENSPSLIYYEIEDSTSSGFLANVSSGTVSISQEFAIDSSNLVEDSTYRIRVKFEDDLENKSGWSEPAVFSVSSANTVDRHSINIVSAGGEIAYWKLDDSLEDEHSLCSLQETSGVLSSIEGIDGSAINTFSGNLKLAPSSSILLTEYTGITFSAYVKFDESVVYSNWQTIFRDDMAFPIIFDSNKKLGRYESVFHDSGFDASTLNGYHLITASWNTSVTKFYVDGRFVGEVPFGTIYDFSDSGNCSIGNYAGTDNQGVIGIDDVRLYDRVLTDDEIFSELYGRSYIDDITHYWAMNTQNPVDYINGRNGSSNFCAIEPTGPIDNETIFNGSTSLVSFSSFSRSIDRYSVSVGFRIDSLPQYTEVLFAINSSNGDGNVCLLLISNTGKLGVHSHNRPSSTNLDSSMSVPIGENNIIIYTRGKLYLNGNVVISGIPLIKIIPGDILSLGMKYDTGLSKGDFFGGAINEVAFWDFFISEQEVIDWTSKTSRPFGGNEIKSLECSAIDRPTILSRDGSWIELTDYFGARTENKTEYQIFDRFALSYDSPLVEHLVPFDTKIKIAKEVVSRDYKVRARYYDIDNNKSLWSREVIMNIFFIPNTIYEMLLVDNKDTKGITGLSQIGTPIVSNGFCQLGMSEYFKFDRIDFSSGSISFWVKFDDLDSSHGGKNTMIMGGDTTEGNDSYIWYRVDTSLFEITNSSNQKLMSSNSFVPTAGQWYNIIITEDNNEIKLYVDMIELGVSPVGIVSIEYLGYAWGDSMYDFVGGIKGFRIFDNVLTYDERLDVFQEYD